MRDRWGKDKASKGQVGAALIVLEGPGKGDEFPIASELSIGRTQDNTLVRIERGVSRRHCTISDEGGVYTLEDHKSANGTLINEKRVESLEVLRHGDRVMIGETTFLFHWPEGHVESGLSTSPGLALTGDDTKPGGGDSERVARIKAILRRPLVIVALAVMTLVLTGGMVKVLFCGAEVLGGPDDLSDIPVRYSETMEFRRTAFGLGNNDNARPDKAVVEFEYLKGRVTLRYSAWGIDETGEVVIRVNGKQVGDVPATQEYRHELRLELPVEVIQDGTNQIEFDSTKNPPSVDPWEIGYLRIVHEPFLPPNPEAAREQYGQGLRLYEDREVDPANRYRAFEKFRMTRNLLEKSEPRPPMYDEASAMMDRVSEELYEIFELGRFSAERSYRFEDVEEARGFLRRTLRYFPDQDDVRHDELARPLQALEDQ